ncbi:MAG: winged helix-turn-helix transcriptional regulator [Nitratireductor sp.]|nr:winged helix-turn-helix transcriptional regulator [Nitratireductor sp.]
MVEQQSDELRLSEVLKAASDPTRRSILTTLVQEGPMRVTDLAAYYRMSLNSVSKHIKVLEAAGLVTRKTVGRVHYISAELGPVSLFDNWFKQLRSTWEMRLEKLDALLNKDEQDERSEPDSEPSN